LAVGDIETPAGKFKDALFGRRRASFRRTDTAKHGTDRGQQFAWIGYLGDIVIGSHFETDDPVHLFSHRRQHDDRQRAGRTDSAAQGQAVLTGQH
jgi:hypothetical protein